MVLVPEPWCRQTHRMWGEEIRSLFVSPGSHLTSMNHSDFWKMPRSTFHLFFQGHSECPILGFETLALSDIREQWQTCQDFLMRLTTD